VIGSYAQVRTRCGRATAVPEEKSGHFPAFSQVGRPVVLLRTGTHDGHMSSTAQQPAGPRRAADVSMTAYLCSDLEWFWPSRRGHAYDEFCR
jgi:hypothetical protein